MEIRNLDELQKLNVIENSDVDVELCKFTCGASCTATGISPDAEE